MNIQNIDIKWPPIGASNASLEFDEVYKISCSWQLDCPTTRVPKHLTYNYATIVP
jgi:hypothetical protein